MVYLSGSEISSGFTDGTSVVAIYTYGCQVWPSEESWNGSGIGPEVHPGDYYISWTPSDASGVFSIAGRNYRLEDYGGYFNDFDGVITSNAFNGLSITSLETNAVKIEYAAFQSCYSLSNASLSYCSMIGTSAFASCLNLRTVSASRCTWVSDYAFFRAAGLSTISLPKCTYIGKSAFRSCYTLHHVDLSECVQINSYAFADVAIGGTWGHENLYVKLGHQGLVQFGQSAFYNGGIHELVVPFWLRLNYSGYAPIDADGWISGYHYLSIPELNYYSECSYGQLNSTLMKTSYSSISYFETDATGMGGTLSENWGVCDGFTELVSVNMPHCDNISYYAFRGCSKLKTLTTGLVSRIYDQAFAGCTSLESMILPSCCRIYSSAFSGCTSLSYVQLGLGIPSLMSRSLCEISGSNVFNGCTNLQAIYVPSQYYSNYINDSYWSWYSDIIISYSI